MDDSRYYNLLNSSLFDAKQKAYENISFSLKDFPNGIRGFRKMFILIQLGLNLFWIWRRLSFVVGRKTLSIKDANLFVQSINHYRMAELFQAKYPSANILDITNISINANVRFCLSISYSLIIKTLLMKKFKNYVVVGDYYRYLILSKLFKSIKIEGNGIAIFLNDHSPFEVALNEFLRSNKIRTGYLQHSWINGDWPECYFDYLFLDGPFFQNFLTKGFLKPKCFYVGNMYKSYFKPFYERKERVLGVALSQSTSTFQVKCLIPRVHDNFPDYKIILRWHPTDNRYLIDNFYDKYENSSGKEESSSDFLSRISILLGGNTNMLYEATVNGVGAGYLQNFDSAGYDYYGFVKNKIVPVIQWSKSEDACQLLFNHYNYNYYDVLENKFCVGLKTPNYKSRDVLKFIEKC